MADRFDVAGAIVYYRRKELVCTILGDTPGRWRAQRMVEILEDFDA